MRRSHFLLGAICVAIVGSAGLGANPDTVVIRPREIQDVLVNPGMGIQTFQRFAGQPIRGILATRPLPWSGGTASSWAAR